MKTVAALYRPGRDDPDILDFDLPDQPSFDDLDAILAPVVGGTIDHLIVYVDDHPVTMVAAAFRDRDGFEINDGATIVLREAIARVSDDPIENDAGHKGYRHRLRSPCHSQGLIIMSHEIADYTNIAEYHLAIAAEWHDGPETALAAFAEKKPVNLDDLIKEVVDARVICAKSQHKDDQMKLMGLEVFLRTLRRKFRVRERVKAAVLEGQAALVAKAEMISWVEEIYETPPNFGQ